MSTSKRVDKNVVVHLRNGVVLHCTKKKKKGNCTFCDNMGGPGDCYAKCNKPIGERKLPYDLMDM